MSDLNNISSIEQARDGFVQLDDIQLHYLEFTGAEPTLILMHGLTANAAAFNGLTKAGLSPHFHVISVDLRGRGLSDHPTSGYSIAEHAKDIIGLLDHLHINAAILGGHSFGALLSLYLAAHYPDRVNKIILLDAAARLHPNTREMLVPAMSRLGKTFSSFEAYLEKMKQAPYNNFWDETMLSYYRRDVKENADGSVIPRSSPGIISEAATNILSEPWIDYIKKVSHPTLLINGTENYTLNAPLLPEENALETVNMMQNCRYVKVDGNHQTMLYGKGAKQTVTAIKEFLKN